MSGTTAFGLCLALIAAILVVFILGACRVAGTYDEHQGNLITLLHHEEASR